MAPPPAPSAVLLMNVQLMILAVPLKLAMAPPPRPSAAVFPLKVVLVIETDPRWTLAIAPPWLAASLPKVLLVTMSVPPSFRIPPPAPPGEMVLPSAMVRFSTVNVTPEFTENNMLIMLSPLMTIRPPPSMVVSMAMVFLVTMIACGSAPQLKVTLPPPASAVSSALSVQLAGVPSPTTPAAKDSCTQNARQIGATTTATNERGFMSPLQQRGMVSRPLPLGGAAVKAKCAGCSASQGPRSLR